MAKKYFDNLHFRDANETIYVQDSEAREEISNLSKQSDKLFVRENRSKGRNERSRLWWNNLNIWK